MGISSFEGWHSANSSASQETGKKAKESAETGGQRKASHQIRDPWGVGGGSQKTSGTGGMDGHVAKKCAKEGRERIEDYSNRPDR